MDGARSRFARVVPWWVFIVAGGCTVVEALPDGGSIIAGPSGTRATRPAPAAVLVTGVVRDVSGDPRGLPAVHLSIGDGGAVTDTEGRFAVERAPGLAVVEVRAPGLVPWRGRQVLATPASFVDAWVARAAAPALIRRGGGMVVHSGPVAVEFPPGAFNPDGGELDAVQYPDVVRCEPPDVDGGAVGTDGGSTDRDGGPEDPDGGSRDRDGGPVEPDAGSTDAGAHDGGPTCPVVSPAVRVTALTGSALAGVGGVRQLSRDGGFWRVELALSVEADVPVVRPLVAVVDLARDERPPALVGLSPAGLWGGWAGPTATSSSTATYDLPGAGTFGFVVPEPAPALRAQAVRGLQSGAVLAPATRVQTGSSAAALVDAHGTLVTIGPRSAMSIGQPCPAGEACLARSASIELSSGRAAVDTGAVEPVGPVRLTVRTPVGDVVTAGGGFEVGVVACDAGVVMDVNVVAGAVQVEALGESTRLGAGEAWLGCQGCAAPRLSCGDESECGATGPFCGSGQTCLRCRGGIAQTACVAISEGATCCDGAVCRSGTRCQPCGDGPRCCR